MQRIDLHIPDRTLIDEPPGNECFLSVVVPVRNEAAHLEKTLGCLTGQVDLKNRPLRSEEYEIIFLVNNSGDESAEIIRRWREKKRNIHLAEMILPPENSNIGYVRRRLMNEAFGRLRNNKFGGGIIATTDGDTAVAPDWLASTLAEIEKGAAAVGGRISIYPSERQAMSARCRAFHLRDTGYRLMAAELESYLDAAAHDPFPRHHQHFNGSFAVTTSAFEKAGGIPEARFLEDVAFYRALLRVDAKFRHSPFVRVQTSARRDGRTEMGLSTQINEWTVMGENGADYLVESLGALEKRLTGRKILRNLRPAARKNPRSADCLKSLADELLIGADFLKDRLSESSTFGLLYEKITDEQRRLGEWERRNPLVTIERALADLRLKLAKLRRGAA